MKEKLLIIELWQVGDLTLATPFIRRACERYDVTLLAKPFSADLQKRFWPPVKVIPFNAPWTAFNRKYRLYSWPWGALFSVWKKLRRERFDVAVSAHAGGDPRDHFVQWLSGAKMRVGFPRTGSQIFLTHPLKPVDPLAHRYENWRMIAQALKLDLESSDQIIRAGPRVSRTVLIHTGAKQPVRVWPLERYENVARRLRAEGYEVKILCNPDQLEWLKNAGEKTALAPRTIAELIACMDGSGVFIGNDSGPGHLAAFCGVPTFTIFGPQVPEWFKPLHPGGELIEGKACPYKPCSDSCRFPTPHCIINITEEEVWARLVKFLPRHLPEPLARIAEVT